MWGPGRAGGDAEGRGLVSSQLWWQEGDGMPRPAVGEAATCPEVRGRLYPAPAPPAPPPNPAQHLE